MERSMSPKGALMIDAAAWLMKSLPRYPSPASLFPFAEILTVQRSLRVHLSSGKSPPLPFSTMIWTSFLHHTYRMRVFLVLDPRPAVIQSVSRQWPGPLSARAKRRNATPRRAALPKAAIGKTGHWIIRKHRPRTLGGGWVAFWPILCRACRSRYPVGLRLTDHR
jgi:hypothetical protein